MWISIDPLHFFVVYSITYAPNFSTGYLFKVYVKVRNGFAKMFDKVDPDIPPIIAGLLTGASLTPQSIPAGFVTVNQIIAKTLPVSGALWLFVSVFVLFCGCVWFMLTVMCACVGCLRHYDWLVVGVGCDFNS
jgi:hypothetical protein